MTDVSLPAAGLAGILSFLSPCVLPLVPPYLCFLAGTTIEELGLTGEAVFFNDSWSLPGIRSRSDVRKWAEDALLRL